MALLNPQSAASALSELLRSPEDLLKLSVYRKKLLKEKAQLDAKLNAGVKSQLDATREGLRKLQAGKTAIGLIREEMIGIEKLKDGTERDEDAFAKITKVSEINRNLTQTATMINQLRSMSNQVAYLSDLLESDKSQPGGPLGPSPNLLHIHYQLQQLESFRNETLHQAKKSTSNNADEERRMLKERFEELDRLSKQFEAWLWEIAKNVVALTRKKNGGTVVKLLKIIEVEGKADQRAVAMRLIRKIAATDASQRFRSMQANARVIKNYRHKFLNVLSESVKQKFAKAMEDADGNIMAFIEDLQWMYQDILRIESDVVPLFPEDYEIYMFYVKTYHKCLNETLQKIVDSSPEASVLLRLHAWIKEYRSNMKELEIPKAWLEPPLLDGKSQDLIKDYVQLIVFKIDEWTVNLMKTETRDFSARDAPPETEADRTYGMQGAVILFQMVNQQIDLAADSGQGAVLARVVSESARVMKDTQARWSTLLDTEYKRQIEKPEEVPPGLVEYAMALANDQLKCADYAEALSVRLEPLVSDKYKSVISEELNSAIDGYLDVAKKCTKILIDLVFNDLKVASQGLFTQKWYTEALTEQIVETMRDYMADYQGHLNPSIFDLLVEDLLVNFLTIYLNALRKVHSKALKIPVALERFKEDVRLVFTFFSEYKPAADLQSDFEILDMIAAMLSASPQMIFMDFWSFAKKYGPNIHFVEAILKGRDDMDRAKVSEVMDTLKRKVKDEGLGDPPEPTIMLRVQSGKDGLLSNLSNLSSLAASYVPKRAFD